MADKDTAELLNRLRGTPIGDRILNYLAQRDMAPTIERYGWLGNANATFSNPSNRNDPGVIKYSGDVHPKFAANMLLHELTHAADRQISRDALDYATTDPQLYDAWLKLSTPVARPMWGERLPERAPRQEMAYRMSPQWYEKNKNYRAGNRELPAWGVADTVVPMVGGDEYSPPSHLNATLAQEFDILLDLASRAKKKK